jgi:hypothetical protein
LDTPLEYRSVDKPDCGSLTGDRIIPKTADVAHHKEHKERKERNLGKVTLQLRKIADTFSVLNGLAQCLKLGDNVAKYARTSALLRRGRQQNR